MKALILAAATLFSLSASAAELSFNTLEGSYNQFDLDCSSNCDGFSLEGSVGFNETFYGTAGLDTGEFSGADVTALFLTGGARHMISDSSAVYGELGFVRVDSDDFDAETDAVAVVGIRGMFNPSFEGEAELSRIFQSGADVELGLKGTFFFTDTVGGFLGVSASDGDTGASVGLRLNF
jgi:hypothetical protein